MKIIRRNTTKRQRQQREKRQPSRKRRVLSVRVFQRKKNTPDDSVRSDAKGAVRAAAPAVQPALATPAPAVQPVASVPSLLEALSPVERYVLNLIAAVNCGAPVPRVPEGQWGNVREELFKQTVYCIPADHMDDLGLSPEESQRYLMDVAGNVRSWYSLMGVQSAVLALFDNAGIPAVVLKGAAAAAQYPRPEYRCMGDIDLIVRPCDFDRALELMFEDGWHEEQKNEAYLRHVGLFKDGCPEVELHRFFSVSDDAARDHRFDERIYAGIDHREFAQLNGHKVSMLPSVENGLILLSHMNHHLVTGLGLRQVLDWQYFIESYGSDAFWRDGFQAACQGIGLENLALVATKMCRAHLGLKRDITWCDCADDALSDELMAYVVSRGNMGRKEALTHSKIRTVLRSMRNPVSAVRYLYTAGKVHWAPGRRHTWLAPATCVYQIGHLVRMGVTGGARAANIMSASQNAKQDVDFLTRLGATRM